VSETSTTEYAIRYTEHSAFNGRLYEATSPLGSSSDPDAADAALRRAEQVREYQARTGLPVDAIAVVCTVTVSAWRPVMADTTPAAPERTETAAGGLGRFLGSPNDRMAFEGCTALRERIAEAVANAECEQQPKCPQCIADAVLAVRDDELAAALVAVADYENRITWDTTCKNCATVLDGAYAETVRAEKAEAALARVRRLCDLTIAASCRVQAIDQAHDTLAVLELPTKGDEACGDRCPQLYGTREVVCTLPKGHAAHRSGGTAWEVLCDEVAQRAELDSAALARVRALAECWKYVADRKNGPLRELLAALDVPADGEQVRGSCSYPCDADCDADCHQEHMPSWKRDPAACATCRGQALDLPADGEQPPTPATEETRDA
jgi:hypothetical protein